MKPNARSREAEAADGQRCTRKTRPASRSDGVRKSEPDRRTDRGSSVANRRGVIAAAVALLVVGSVLAVGSVAAGIGGATPAAVAPPSSLDSAASDLDGVAASSLGIAANESAANESGPADDRVVVRLADDRVVTGAAAEETPPNPGVTADGVGLVVEDGAVVTENGQDVYVGDYSIRTVSSDPDIVVTDGDVVRDTLRVNESSGIVESAGGGVPATTETGTVVEFEGYDETNFVPEIVETETVGEGQILPVTTDVRNYGYGGGSKEVRFVLLDGDGSRLAEMRQNVSLAGGESTTVSFDYETEPGDHEAETVAVRADGHDDAPITIDRARTMVSITDWNQTTTAGEEFVVTAVIDRQGNHPAGQQDFLIDFWVDNSLVTTNVASLEPNQNTTETFTYRTDDDDPPNVDVEIASGTDADSATVSVQAREGEAGPETGTSETDDPANESANETEAAPSTDGDGIPWTLALLGLFGVAVSAVGLVLYRNGSLDSLRSNGVAAFGGLGALGGLGSGGGTLIVHNELPRETLVRVRCRTPDGTVLLEDLELRPDERRDLGSVPDAERVTVGAGVEDITAHEEVFRGVGGDISVVLRAEGILIASRA